MFTPIETTIGAALLQQATSNLLYQNGAVLGASGFLRRLFTTPSRDTISFFAGMAMSFVPLKLFLPEMLPSYPSVPATLQGALVTVGIGLLVGLGTKLANGCTSGHMLCGLSRLSGRSTLAVATFFPVALITHHLAHPSLETGACPPGIPCFTLTYPSQSRLLFLLILATVTIVAAKTIPRLVAQTETAPAAIQNGAGTNGSATKPTAPPDAGTPTAAQHATEFFSGLQFGLGLHITQMSDPSKVLAFLSFPNMQAWDPSMALIILFAVLPNLIENQMLGFKGKPEFKNEFNLPKKTLKDTDWQFVLGAALFGVGWGLCGVCPGPAALRAMAQPVWGAMWMGGFVAGSKLIS